MAVPKASSVMDVLVVGCGASGVAALRRLHDAGLRALGLEAAGRVGGRVCTVPFGGGAVDVGAQWCHGEKDNIVYELVKDLGLLGRPQPEEKVFLLSDGGTLPTDEGKELVNTLNAVLEKADKNNSKSIPECLREAVTDKKVTSKNSDLLHPFLEWYERNSHVGGQGAPARSKSLRGLEEGQPCDGEQLLNWKDRGYKTLLDVLLNSYPDPQARIPVEILLGKEVESIKWKRSKTDAEAASPLVQVTCRDGSLYAAKCVIVTVSVGVLQERHEQMFSPPLPEEKVRAINNLELCVLDKIYLQFSQPWWRKAPCYFSAIWRPEDKAGIPEDEWWLTEVYAFSTVECQPNLLCAWIYGEGAKAMEKVSMEAVREGVAKVLRMFFAKQYSVSNIVDIKRSTWASDRLIRGAYSHRCVATEAAGGGGGGGAEALAEPLYYDGRAPKVCFAGEATSARRHGAVHGAVEAGFREAERIIQHMRG